MTALLCAGIATATPDAAHCKPVEGAQTSYFGADQPRITSETLLPWPALGLDGPPGKDRLLKVEVSTTAWHRSRWMSLSGMAPEQGDADPKHWGGGSAGRGQLMPPAAPAPTLIETPRLTLALAQPERRRGSSPIAATIGNSMPPGGRVRAARTSCPSRSGAALRAMGQGRTGRRRHCA